MPTTPTIGPITAQILCPFMPPVPPNTSSPCMVQTAPDSTSNTPMIMNARFTRLPPSRRGTLRHPQHPAGGLDESGVEAGRRPPQEQTEAPVERFTPARHDLVALRVQPLRPTQARQVVVVPV